MIAAAITPEQVASDPLLARYREFRDDASLQEIMREHLPTLRVVARRILHRPDLVEDAVQEAFIRFIRSRDDIRGPVGPWLSTVVFNAALNLLRSESVRRRRESEFASESGLREAGQALDDEVRRLIGECIATLEEAQRSVIARVFFLGKTQAEIAVEDGVTQVAVHKRMRKALSQLRWQIIKHGLGDCFAAVSSGFSRPAHAGMTPPDPAMLSLLALSSLPAIFERACRVGTRAGLSCAALASKVA